MMRAATGNEADGRWQLLSAFLRERRRALRPADVGLPGTRAVRRVVGLRREEVAVLADVGITWYTWLEQGRPINIARGTLERIADALRLDRHQRAYLHLLAFGSTASVVEKVELSPSVVRVVQSYTAGPAYVRGPRWDLLAWNDVFRRFFRIARDGNDDRNLLRYLFLDPNLPEVLIDWPQNARIAVSAFRVSYAGHVGDEAFESLIAELLTSSPLFAELWRASEVLSPNEMRTARLLDPSMRMLLFSTVALIVPDVPETTVIFGLIDSLRAPVDLLRHLDELGIRDVPASWTSDD
jgi:transcriptional regulator with XRE-family HTH domain